MSRDWFFFQIFFSEKMIFFQILLKWVVLCLLSDCSLFDQAFVLLIHLEYLCKSFSKTVSFINSVLRGFSSHCEKTNRRTGASGFRTKLPPYGLWLLKSEYHILSRMKVLLNGCTGYRRGSNKKIKAQPARSDIGWALGIACRA